MKSHWIWLSHVSFFAMLMSGCNQSTTIEPEQLPPLQSVSDNSANEIAESRVHLASYEPAEHVFQEPQIRVKVQVIEFAAMPQAVTAFEALWGKSEDQDQTIKESRSRVMSAKCLQTSLASMTAQGLIKTTSEPDLTLASGQSGTWSDGAEWAVVATTAPDGILLDVNGKLSVTSWQTRASASLGKGDMAVIEAWPATVLVTEVSRPPIFGELPFIGPMLSQKRSMQETHHRLLLLTAETNESIAP